MVISGNGEAAVCNPWVQDWSRSAGHFVPARTERINNLRYFVLLSETKQCFILKIYQLLFVTSVYGSRLMQLYYSI